MPPTTPIAHKVEDGTPYSAYIKTEQLHSLQKTLTEHPAEFGFIINVQVMELYWMLIIRDIEVAQRALRVDDLPAAAAALQRVVLHHEPLNATWKSLEWMTPSDLLPVLKEMATTFGQDTALQGWTYRHMVYLLGIKQTEHLDHFVTQPARLRQLEDVLRAPSLYDDVLAYMSRQGLPVPELHLNRDVSRPYVENDTVQRIWHGIYSEPSTYADLRALGEILMNISDRFTDWKYKHLLATRRTIGLRPAYYGQIGVDWLAPTLDERPFPELWSARTFIGDDVPPMRCPHAREG